MQYPTLRVWLAANDMSLRQFSERYLGFRSNRLSQYLSGDRRMPLKVAVRIVEITGIPIESLVVNGRRSSRHVA